MHYKVLRKSYGGILVTDGGSGRGEPLPSLMCGVPSLAIGLGAGADRVRSDRHSGRRRRFYDVQWSPDITTGTLMAGPVPAGTVVCVAMPSPLLLLLLLVGVICGGVGMVIADERGAGQAVTCIAGVIACAAALVLAYISYMVAAT